MKKTIKKTYKPSKKSLKEQMLGYIDPTKQDPNYRPKLKPMMQYFADSYENGEHPEHVFLEIIGGDYNRARNGHDAVIFLNNRKRVTEFKRTRKTSLTKVGMDQLWSYHSKASRLGLISADLTGVFSGMVDGQIAFIILVEDLNRTKIFTPSPTLQKKEDNNETWTSKVDKNHNDVFVPGANPRLLYINRDLIKKYAVTTFANQILAMNEEFESIFGFSFRNFLGLDPDRPTIWYKKDDDVSITPKLSSGDTTFEISPTFYRRSMVREYKKLQSGQHLTLQYGKYQLLLRNNGGKPEIKCPTIDSDKAKHFRPFDLAIKN